MVRDTLKKSPGGEIHIIAHSMGGFITLNWLVSVLPDEAIVENLGSVSMFDSPLHGLPRSIPKRLWGNLPEFFGCFPYRAAALSQAVEEMRRAWIDDRKLREQRASVKRWLADELKKRGVSLLTIMGAYDRLYCGPPREFGSCDVFPTDPNDPRWTQVIGGYELYSTNRRQLSRDGGLLIGHSTSLFDAKILDVLETVIGPQNP